MNKYYRQCVDILSSVDGYEIRYDYYSLGDNMTITLISPNGVSVKILIQNVDTPEVDIQVEKLKLYLSLGSSGELIKTIKSLKDDLIDILIKDSVLIIKKPRLFNVWFVAQPSNLRILKSSWLVKKYPGETSTLTF